MKPCFISSKTTTKIDFSSDDDKGVVKDQQEEKENLPTVGNFTLGKAQNNSSNSAKMLDSFQHEPELNMVSITKNNNKAIHKHQDKQENETITIMSLTEDESDTKLVEDLDTLKLAGTIPFSLQKEECDFWFKTKTGMVGFPSDYVKWISKELHTMCTGEGVSGERTIVELDISEESLIHVISFFHPKHFTPLKGTYFLIGIIMHMKI